MQSKKNELFCTHCHRCVGLSVIKHVAQCLLQCCWVNSFYFISSIVLFSIPFIVTNWKSILLHSISQGAKNREVYLLKYLFEEFIPPTNLSNSFWFSTHKLNYFLKRKTPWPHAHLEANQILTGFLPSWKITCWIFNLI